MGVVRQPVRLFIGVIFLFVGFLLLVFMGRRLVARFGVVLEERYPMAICMTVIEFEMFYRT